ncbi:MAG: hypothetical protein JNM36_03730 [Chitinophagales bacterium]|nr:hypothetical protein [Chitinophagales bacterium]
MMLFCTIIWACFVWAIIHLNPKIISTLNISNSGAYLVSSATFRFFTALIKAIFALSFEFDVWLISFSHNLNKTLKQ